MSIKDNSIEAILKYKPVKYLVAVLLLMLVYTGFLHIYRCHKGLNSKFLWGAGECIECKVYPTTVQTVYKDTCLKNSTLDKKQSNVYDTKINKARDVNIGEK